MRSQCANIGEQRIGVTVYYEVLAYAEYKKHLNIMREYLIKEFNNKLLPLVQKKNDIKSSVILEYKGFISNEIIDQALKRYQLGEIDVNGFITAIKDDYNQKLF